MGHSPEARPRLQAAGVSEVCPSNPADLFLRPAQLPDGLVELGADAQDEAEILSGNAIPPSWSGPGLVLGSAESACILFGARPRILLFL